MDSSVLKVTKAILKKTKKTDWYCNNAKFSDKTAYADKIRLVLKSDQDLHSLSLHLLDTLLYKPRHEKTCLWGLQPG